MVEGYPVIQTHNDFFTFASGYGYHEVIAETPFHDKQLWDLPLTTIRELFKIYNSRITELSSRQNIKYVAVFKNHGRDAGTSIAHSHTQVVGINFIPGSVREKCEKSKNECPYCRILNIEKNSYRRCFENESMVAFTPYASRFAYEIWVFPKRHLRNMNEFSEKDYSDMAEIMQKILGRLKQLNASFNYFIHYSPAGENLHFHIEVMPRMATWGGFEFSTETIINSIAPEDAARFYRGEEVI
jgi:UDPglucose--hexose-1-phosphate uridylyltransferase